MDIFQLFISDEKIACWMNDWFPVKKASEPNKHKAPFEPITDIYELKAYFGILLAVNQNIDLPRYEHYFHQDESKWLLLTPGFHKVFLQKRFSQLNRYIFCCDPRSLNEDDRNRDKLAKVRLFLEHLHAACKDNFNCGKNIAIDEAMIPYKGKLSIKQRILGKPVRWGIKLFRLCDSETAYVSRFEVYLGKARDNEDTSAIGKGGALVARLTNDFHHNGHCLFIDNWYSSLALSIFLKSRGIYLCCTTRSNRRGYPAQLKAFQAPAQNRGASSLRVYQGVVAFVWKDSKPMHFLSTAHYPDEVATVQRQQKERCSGQYSVKEVESHKIVVDYNANMGAVDTNDQMTTVRKSKKQLRWYMRLIVKFLEISAYNSYIIEGHFKEHLPKHRRKKDFTAFTEDLIHELV